MQGIVEELFEGAVFHEAASVHDAHAVRYLGHHAEVVGDEQNGHAAAHALFVEYGEHLPLYGGVESRGGLIGEQE